MVARTQPEVAGVVAKKGKGGYGDFWVVRGFRIQGLKQELGSLSFLAILKRKGGSQGSRASHGQQQGGLHKTVSKCVAHG